MDGWMDLWLVSAAWAGGRGAQNQSNSRAHCPLLHIAHKHSGARRCPPVPVLGVSRTDARRPQRTRPAQAAPWSGSAAPASRCALRSGAHAAASVQVQLQARASTQRNGNGMAIARAPGAPSPSVRPSPLGRPRLASQSVRIFPLIPATCSHQVRRARRGAAHPHSMQPPTAPVRRFMLGDMLG